MVSGFPAHANLTSTDSIGTSSSTSSEGREGGGSGLIDGDGGVEDVFDDTGGERV